MQIQYRHLSSVATHFLRESALPSLTPLQKKVMAIAAIAIAWFAAIYILRRCLNSLDKDAPLKLVRYEQNDKILQTDGQILKPDDVLLTPVAQQLKEEDQLPKREEKWVKLEDQMLKPEEKVHNQEKPILEPVKEVHKVEDPHNRDDQMSKINDVQLNPDDQILKTDDVLLKPVDQRLKPDWVNAHPNVPLETLGLINFNMLQDFLKEHGKELKCLNLQCIDQSQMLDNGQF